MITVTLKKRSVWGRAIRWPGLVLAYYRLIRPTNGRLASWGAALRLSRGLFR